MKAVQIHSEMMLAEVSASNPDITVGVLSNPADKNLTIRVILVLNKHQSFKNTRLVLNFLDSFQWGFTINALQVKQLTQNHLITVQIRVGAQVLAVYDKHMLATQEY